MLWDYNQAKNIKITKKGLNLSEVEKTEKDKEENLVKKTCQELGITQKELAEKTGFSQNALSRWNKGSKPPITAEKFFNTLIENQELNKLKQQLFKLKVI